MSEILTTRKIHKFKYQTVKFIYLNKNFFFFISEVFLESYLFNIIALL